MIRPLVSLAILAGLLAIPSTVAAADCRMSATVDPGRAIEVAGAGWPVAAGVTLVATRNGSEVATLTLATDAAGGFATSLPAGPGLGGAYGLVATSGSCEAVADVVAVETAGAGGGTLAGGSTGGSTGGTGPSLPPTDASPATGDGRTISGLPLALVVGLLAAAGLGLLLAAGYPRAGTRRG